MKKILIFTLTVTLCICLIGCNPSTQPPLLLPSDNPPQSEDDNLPKEEEPINLLPQIDVAEHELKKMVSFVTPFNTLPQEFSSISELSDYTMFFSAVARLNSEFQPMEDGYTYYIALKEIPAAVRALFGSGAQLSEAYLLNSYEPYSIDSENEVVYKTSMGTVANTLYPYRCIKTSSGYDLYMLNLADPLFIEKYPEFADGANEVAVNSAMVEDIASDMMAHVFKLVENSDGSYFISGFNYVNKKDISTSMM